MYNQAISQKFQTSNNELILGLVSGSTISVFEDSENITNTYRPETLKLQGIKYFHFLDTIYGFSNLKPNWDSYNADVISKNAIDTAIVTLNYLNSRVQLSNDFTVSVFPMRDGGIQFEFDGENICAELEINQNGELKFILFDDDGSINYNGQLFEVSELSTLLEESQYAI
jgi:hypothetical protein